MNCEEAQSLHGAYLDSELDTKTTLEVAAHLKECPECARRFAEGEKLEAQLKAGLNRGQRSAALWERIEHSVAVAASVEKARPFGTPTSERAGSWQTALAVLGGQIQAAWRRSRWAWASLAAVWAVILMLNVTARAPASALAVAQNIPSASEVRLAWQQKQLLMADLSSAREPAPADKAKAAPPRPRSERTRRMLNS